MKILLVIDHYYPHLGGVEKLFKTLAESLTENHRVTVITSRHHKNVPVEETINGVHVIRMPMSRFLFTFFGFFKVLPYVHKNDLVITSTYNSVLSAKIASLLMQRKIVLVFHEVWGKLWFKLPYLNRVQKIMYYMYERMLLLFNYDRIIAVSEFTRQRILERGQKAHKVQLIYNGLIYSEAENHRWLPPENFTFTYFGRLGVSKGLDVFLKAAAQFIETHPDARVKLIVPTHPEHLFHKIISEVNRMNGSQNVSLYHNLSFNDLMQEVTTSSCVVIPSQSEGFCFSAAEAAAVGVPIISSHKGALPETVSGQHIALEKLDAEHLFLALLRAYHDDWDNKPLRKFEMGDTVTQYQQLIHELLAHKITPLSAQT